MQTSIRLAAPILPCPTQVFEIAELEAARRWMQEPLGSIHVTDLGGPCVQISLFGKLDPDAYSKAEQALDAVLQGRESVRLLVDLSEFDGWQGLSALAVHFRLARNHIRLLDRVAIVGDAAWQHIAQRVAHHILSVRTQFFPSAEMENAKFWLTAG